MSKEGTFQMLAREEMEDIEDFITRMRGCLAKAHRERSPVCASKTVEYVKIPVENDMVGGSDSPSGATH